MLRWWFCLVILVLSVDPVPPQGTSLPVASNPASSGPPGSVPAADIPAAGGVPPQQPVGDISGLPGGLPGQDFPPIEGIPAAVGNVTSSPVSNELTPVEIKALEASLDGSADLNAGLLAAPYPGGFDARKAIIDKIIRSDDAKMNELKVKQNYQVKYITLLQQQIEDSMKKLQRLNDLKLTNENQIKSLDTNLKTLKKEKKVIDYQDRLRQLQLQKQIVIASGSGVASQTESIDKSIERTQKDIDAVNSGKDIVGVVGDLGNPNPLTTDLTSNSALPSPAPVMTPPAPVASGASGPAPEESAAPAAEE